MNPEGEDMKGRCVELEFNSISHLSLRDAYPARAYLVAPGNNYRFYILAISSRDTNFRVVRIHSDIRLARGGIGLPPFVGAGADGDGNDKRDENPTQALRHDHPLSMDAGLYAPETRKVPQKSRQSSQVSIATAFPGRQEPGPVVVGW